MRFKELDERMRKYETVNDTYIMPSVYSVARIDGRSFSKLTKSGSEFEKPFDVRFRDMMVDTVNYLMESDFGFIYGYTESDEISLFFDPSFGAFGRKERKLNSVLAGEASGKFSILLGKPVSFDCRISQLPAKQLVVDYFRWRNEDANRNCLSSWCYWKLREQGKNKRQATKVISGMSVKDKNELLYSLGTNYNDVPSWQKRGTGLYWKEYDKEGNNPLTGEKVMTKRRKVEIDYELPMKEDYSKFIRGFVPEITF